MSEVKIQKTSNILIGLGVIFLIMAGFFYWRSRETGEIIPGEFEEIIVQEDMAVRKNGKQIKPLTEEEIAKIKEETDGVLSLGGEAALLEDLESVGIKAEAKRAFSDGKFYYRLKGTGFALPEKGYYFEGWFKKDDDFLSIGRLEINTLGGAELYYTASEDRSDYSQILITLEPEDGNSAPAKIVLEGRFK